MQFIIIALLVWSMVGIIKTANTAVAKQTNVIGVIKDYSRDSLIKAGPVVWAIYWLNEIQK